MDERARFVLEQEGGLHPVAELCRIYGISRETGYYWLRRYREGGLASLADRGCAPEAHPNETPEAVVQQILGLRRVHMSWGPRKLKRVLEREEPERRWPAASTIGAMLSREGLVVRRRKRRRTAPYTQPFATADAANRVWCADFKGWFRTQDGERIDPLTISDAYSRYLLRCQAVEKMERARVQAIFEAAFLEYGMPAAIRSDNGVPFASTALAGLSRLSLWWMKLGIVPERIAAGHPEQNGRHERMHRTLQQETATPPARNRRAQQRVFDRFREEYNQQRPHEALDMRTPADCYAPSPRPYPARVPEPEYGSALLVRTIRQGGVMCWKHQNVFVSEVLDGEHVGLLPEDEDRFTMYFARFPIACFDSRRRKVLPLPKPNHFDSGDAGEGELPPSPALHPRNQLDQKVSGRCPV